jgi:hypothetical protein
MLIPDTNLNIPVTPAPSRIDDVVDAIIFDLTHANLVKEHTEVLELYGPAAAPRLLHHVKHGDAAARGVAFYALQYCWIDEARDVVAEVLGGDDKSLRKMAALLLAKNLGLSALAKACEPLLNDPRKDVAGFALERLEGEFPDYERVRRFIDRPEMWEHLWQYLPRYFAPELTLATRRIMLQGTLDAPLAALISLIHQNDAAPETRAEISSYLTHAQPNVREVAAEYLMWHGTQNEVSALQSSLANETDVYARGSKQAALNSIERRRASPPPLEGGGWGEGSVSQESLDYRQAFKLLSDSPTPENFKIARHVYQRREKLEPHLAFRGNGPSAAFATERNARLGLQAKLFAIPGNVFTDGQPHRGEFTAPVAEELVAPVRHFFDDARRSYGKDMEDTKEGFGGLFHVGDDMMWQREHRTVVAVGAGLVRQVSCIPTWGCIIVIEHKLPSGERFCSLYAHLSPFVCVAPGEVVEKGQKIGAIGRSFSYENGGYISHLHFAIHEGMYWQTHRPGSIQEVRWEGVTYRGKVLNSNADETWLEIFTKKGPYAVRKSTSWICGYISKQTWEEGKHGWRDPQEFLKENGAH